MEADAAVAQPSTGDHESAKGSHHTLADGAVDATLAGTSGPDWAQLEGKPTRFHGTVALDPTVLGRQAGRIADEVLAHLRGLVGAQALVTLEIRVDVPGGIPEDVVRIVRENCNTLKFRGHE